MITVIVLTMPRSGSSLLAGILHRLGVFFGREEDLVLGRHLNKYGCYENQSFQAINLNILFEANLLLDISRRLEIDEDNLKGIVNKYEDRIISFVRENERELWGFKDPGLIYIMPYIWHHFRNPYYIHLERRTYDTARSLYRTFRPNYWIGELKEKYRLFSHRNRMKIIPRAIRLTLSKHKEYNDRKIFESVIENGHRRIEDFCQNRRVIRICLDDLLESPERTVREIADFLSIRVNQEQFHDALSFIHPELINEPIHQPSSSPRAAQRGRPANTCPSEKPAR